MKVSSCLIHIMLLVFLPIMAFAEPQDLIIKDTSGVARSNSQIESATNIEFSLTDGAGMPANGAEITLTNEATGEVLKAVSADGVVVFEQVPPGTWVVASASPSVTFTNIMVDVAYAAAGLGGAGVGTSVALFAGGSAAVAGTTIAIVESGKDKSHELSPSS